MPIKKKIMVVVDAPGPAEFIEPVIPLLNEKTDVMLVTVNTPTNAPYNVLKKYDPVKCDHETDAEKIYKSFNPDILAVATSSLILGPFVNGRLTELAHNDGKKIICFQDFWANHRHAMNFKMMKYWDKILVPDELARRYVTEDGYEGKITVTGNPSFDRFKDAKEASKDRKLIRSKFGLKSNDFFILYIGQGTPQSYIYDEITFDFLLRSVSEILDKNTERGIILSVRKHPRDERPERYSELASKKGITLFDTSEFPSTDDILPMADLLTGMIPTNHIHACYLRIPAISILLPNAGKKMLERISLTDFPPNAVGAALGIYKDDVLELKNLIQKIISSASFRDEIKKIQEKYFPHYKISSAEKVAREILD